MDVYPRPITGRNAISRAVKPGGVAESNTTLTELTKRITSTTADDDYSPFTISDPRTLNFTESDLGILLSPAKPLRVLVPTILNG